MTTENEAICGKYDSPLVHMQNCAESKPTQVRYVLEIVACVNAQIKFIAHKAFMVFDG